MEPFITRVKGKTYTIPNEIVHLANPSKNNTVKNAIFVIGEEYFGHSNVNKLSHDERKVIDNFCVEILGTQSGCVRKVLHKRNKEASKSDAMNVDEDVSCGDKLDAEMDSASDEE